MIAGNLLDAAEYAADAESIEDPTGEHRLSLRVGPMNHRGGIDFHSLAWLLKDGLEWVERRIITRENFQRGSERRRWIADLHSFDPKTAHAVIRVAEIVPEDGGSAQCVYAWKQWDIRNNREVRLLRICQNPFEPF
jgi:hypothetical protein